MRDYPSVPNVFRVASSHNVSTDDVAYNEAKIANANLPSGQLGQKQTLLLPQSQLQPRLPNGGRKAPLAKPATSAPTKAASTATATASHCAVTSSAAASTTIHASSLVPPHSLNLERQQQPPRLTTHASIERPQPCPSAAQLLLHSPYATLPRNTTASASSLSMHSPSGGSDINVATLTAPAPLSHLRLPSHFASSRNATSSNYALVAAATATKTNAGSATAAPASNSSSGKRQAVELKGDSANNSAMMGVINTISGSIPATGFSLDNSRPHAANGNGRTMSVASDLNASMNNSYTNLAKLNGVYHHQQQQQQQQQQHRQQQQRTQQKSSQSQQQQQRGFKQTPATMDDFTPYRRTPSSGLSCSSVVRSNGNGYLWIVTPVAASISVAIVIAALAGPQWLFTEEKLPNANYNGTANFNVLDDGAFITRYTKSSLWIICSALQGVETYSCIKIDYFSKDGYQPDPHDSASAIPYTVTKSCPFFLASGVVLLLSFIVFLIPTCSHQNNLYYFSAGIMFIVSGLLMLIGLIAYISILKAEIGSKLRPRSSLQPPMFKVTYGQSFFLFVFGFIATEFVGLLNIFLYISLQEVGYYSGKLKIGSLRDNLTQNTYKSFKHDVEKKPLDRVRQNAGKKHQVRAQEMELDTQKLLRKKSHKARQEASSKDNREVDATMFDANGEAPFACRKHPNGLGSSMFLNELDRRYYFEKSSSAQCNLHSKYLAKSLNELYLESTLPPPPPSAVHMGAGGVGLAGNQLAQQQRQRQLNIQTLPRPPQQFSDSPQEFPLTRSVSTTTEIYATQNAGLTANKGERSTTQAVSLAEDRNSNRRRSVATSTRHQADGETQTNGVGAAALGGQQRSSFRTNLAMQHHQQQQQFLSNLYDKRQQHNYAAAHRSGGTHGGHGKKALGAQDDGLDDDNADDTNAAADDDCRGDNEADEEPPQKLCGLRRTIRKTKDELFEEFCKRAGVRPKPKNIYYIENDDDDADEGRTDGDGGGEAVVLRKQPKSKNNSRTASSNNGPQHQRPGKLHAKLAELRGVGSGHSDSLDSNRIYGDAGDREGGLAVDSSRIDDDIDLQQEGEQEERGFKKLNDKEDHLYVIDDNIHLMPQADMRSNRRASMYVEPNHLRRLNSNLSLHTLYAHPRGFQKSLYDLDATAAEYPFPPAAYATPQYLARDGYGGSQNRLHHDYHNQPIYQSRTLPRTMMRRNADSQDSIASAGIMASATQLHNIYSASQQRLTALMLQQQQQQQQTLPQNRYLAPSRPEQEVYGSRFGLHKSNEELNSGFAPQPIYLQQPPQLQYQQQQQHMPHSAMANGLKKPLVQWPAAIPSSPSNFSSGYQMYAAPAAGTAQSSHHALLARSQSGGGNGSVGGSHKFQRAYAFDEQRRPSGLVGDAFDLEELERERRRSQMNLYAGTLGVSGSPAIKTNGLGGGVGVGGVGAKATAGNRDHYDMINGTAV